MSLQHFLCLIKQCLTVLGIYFDGHVMPPHEATTAFTNSRLMRRQCTFVKINAQHWCLKSY